MGAASQTGTCVKRGNAHSQNRSLSGHLYKMALAEQECAKFVEGVDVTLLQVPRPCCALLAPVDTVGNLGSRVWNVAYLFMMSLILSLSN